MALHSSGGCYATTGSLQQYGMPYQPKHSPSLKASDKNMISPSLTGVLFWCCKCNEVKFLSFTGIPSSFCVEV